MENCAIVCRISFVCEVPVCEVPVCEVQVCVITNSGVDVVTRALSVRQLGKVEVDGERVCEGDGVNTATEAVMIGAAVVDERKS